MPASPAKAMIYIVDDDPDVLGSLQFLLETEGFDVRTFRSGAALLKEDAENADCLVIDYKMPNMNGIDLAARLRSREVRVPIILITGQIDQNLPDRASVAGIRHVLRKPHLEESLPGHIRGVLGNVSAGL
ncbi:response regulator [Bradyrhizobium lablabi]|uniref:response regulator transcription factor n=1 Tax=Bradyrhizobium lablabi TaxID=722472 RepID=UPI001BA6D25A|nr:response regulator [Bradyrhizobium lablabi]MBR1125184.1 response regulator [Bradyrhizobium lablabi]